MKKFSFCRLVIGLGLGILSYDNKEKVPPVENMTDFVIFPISITSKPKQDK